MLTKKGKLYVVATPIGNLQDITLRAIETLKAVDKIAAEDTRHATVLLKHFSINKPTISLHAHNENARAHVLIEHLNKGESIALLSDAGTPLISDPGFPLVKLAHQENIPVIPIPGATAAIAALSVAGLPTDRFLFEGFLPQKSASRKKYLETLVDVTATLVFYEAPHRLLASLQDMLSVFGNREAVVARELTKIHESILHEDLQNLVKYYEKHVDQLRGEIVILVSGKKDAEKVSHFAADMVLKILLKELPVKQAAALAAEITGERRKVLYEKALRTLGKL